MKKINLLFVCTGNSCRSQMAEGWARHFGGDAVVAGSAGIEAHGKNPRAIAVMAEAGVDISTQESTRVTDDMLQIANIVVTVCGHADEHCPVLPSGVKKLHWPLSDPARAQGSEEEIMSQFRATRDDVKHRVVALLEELGIKTTTRSSRSEIYFTLSELFKPPVREFAFQLHSGEVKRRMDSWLHSVCAAGFVFPSLESAPATPEQFFVEMKGEYHSLFEGPISPFAPLIESVYKPWDKDGGSIIGNAQGHIMGYPALDMKQRYEAGGIEIPPEYSHAPDHLALLLEFFAIQIETATAVELDEFAKSHLDWIDALVEEALKTGRARHYRPILEFVNGFIKKDAFRADFAFGG